MNSLRIILRINAASCLLFGLLFVSVPTLVSAFLGEVPAIMVQIVGAGLMINTTLLLLTSFRRTIGLMEVIWFSMGDLAWWLATIGLIAGQLWITTVAGIIAALIVGFLVAVLGVMQLWILGVIQQGVSGSARLKLIAHSWMSLPLWVKIWLTILNLIFIFAFWFWPHPLVINSLLAYVATMPLLAGQVAYDGGLRRILGVGHLIAWVPLLFWLTMFSEWHAYNVLLIVVLTICLVLDLADIWRFWRGERGIIGSTEDLKLPEGAN